MKTDQILEAAQRVCTRNKWRKTASRLEEITSAPHYSEPGYSTTYDCILFGNWNRPCRENYVQPESFGARGHWEPETPEAGEENAFFAGVVKALETCTELEWSDEWTTCSDCGGAVRASGDSYGWQRAFVELGVEIICRDCAKKHAEEIITAFENEDNKCLTSDLGINLAEHGYRRMDQEFENGLYGGQDAEPRKIASALRKRDITRFVFLLDSVGQFDLKFSVWIHESETLPDQLEPGETKADLDPAEGLKRALQSAPIPCGPGITYVKCNVADGTSTARKVSPDEFIEGIKD